MWYNSCSASSLQAVDATFTKYLKRYLQVPQHSNNSIIHFLTSTTSLSSRLKRMAPEYTGALSFPEELHGHNLSFLSSPMENFPPTHIDVSGIPSWFWTSRVLQDIPTNQKARKKLCREVLDTEHYKMCKTKTFHALPSSTCICMFCGENAHFFHARFCLLNE